METPWRDDPLLRGLFHRSFPDDLQVVVHQGGPRLSASTPELMWVRLEGAAGRAYRGALLNEPQHLTDIALGEALLVLPAAHTPHPIRTTARYLEERENHDIVACDKCGLGELFDPPSLLVAKIFPSVPAGSLVAVFTTFCPLCGGVQKVVSRRGGVAAPEPDLDRTEVARRWWRPSE